MERAQELSQEQIKKNQQAKLDIRVKVSLMFRSCFVDSIVLLLPSVSCRESLPRAASCAS